MKTPHSALEDALLRAASLDAEGLVFLSGVGAFITTDSGQRPLPMPQQLSAQHVRQLHLACLAVAGRDDLKWLHYARYWMSFPNIGKFLCEYVEQRGTNNLRLRREPEARDWVETDHTPKLPRQAARSLPQSERPRFVEEVDSFVHVDSSDDEPRDATRAGRSQGIS
jgi:hypothetical protein